MLDLFKEFAVNLDAEVNGRWVDYKGVSFLIARANNAKYNKMALELLKDNERLAEESEENEKYFREAFADIQAKTLLLGWKGEIGFKGKAMKYSVENAKKLLSAPEMRDFVQFVLEQATDVDSYRAQLEDEQEKN